jgi:hypothetical protein
MENNTKKVIFVFWLLVLFFVKLNFQIIRFFFFLIILRVETHYPVFYNDIAPWMRFTKASNDATVKNIIKTKKKN